ncbi:MAG: class I SAM-dependent methyltransferase, partial [Zhenhengia sp.]|uniref:class I SAM-dependent methyltransferase n=1 Tax=Zhenhengia sp. TaxID=2944208 RepID=UPI003996B728
MSKYDFKLDLETENALSLIINMIQPNSKILEFGCAHGRLTKYLAEQLKCEVTIVEIDELAGKEAKLYAKNYYLGEVEGDIENYIWADQIQEEFDYIIFADVLEHLYDPKQVIYKCKSLLNNTGSILISLPNIAHDSIIIDLWKNKFKYQNTGLLDDTHIRFFTQSSFMNLIKECGLNIYEVKATYSTVGLNEFDNSYEEFGKTFKKLIKQRPLGNVYQYIYKIGKNNNVSINSQIISYNDYICKLYLLLKGEKHFSDKGTFESSYYPWENNIKVKFNLQDFEGIINGLRIDPLETNCIIKINNIVLRNKTEEILLKVKNTNAEYVLEDTIYIFKNEDPQIHIDYQGKITEVEIEFNLIEYEFENLIYDYFIESDNKKRIMIEQKDNYIEEQRKRLEDRRIIIEQKDNYIEE